MEPTPALTGKPRWWHSRSKRQIAIYLVLISAAFFATYAYRAAFGWGLVFAMAGSRLLDWLCFRYLDPKYPHDDLPQRESYAGPPKATIPREAWLGALAAAGVVGAIMLLIWLI
ncbi:MAG: hypothetical protein ABIT10_01275 [Alteraurantiacibacter sp.]